MDLDVSYLCKDAEKFYTQITEGVRKGAVPHNRLCGTPFHSTSELSILIQNFEGDFQLLFEIGDVAALIGFDEAN